MALKFKKPEVKQERLKILVYGGMGTGKSYLGCSFKDVAFFDTEGTSYKIIYSQLLSNNNSQVIHTGDIDEIIEQVKALMTQKHTFKTIVIDSLTVAYENLTNACEAKVGSDFGRHVALADKKIKQLVNLLLRIDMHCVITCQAKDQYSDNMKIIGQTFSGYKRLGYMCDLVLETHALGDNFFAKVKKSRLATFKTNEEIKFSYDEVIKRCGLESIEQEVTPEELASIEEVSEAKRLVTLLNVTDEVIDKWFTKAQCDSFEDMPADMIRKCIKLMRDKIDNKETNK